MSSLGSSLVMLVDYCRNRLVNRLHYPLGRHDFHAGFAHQVLQVPHDAQVQIAEGEVAEDMRVSPYPHGPGLQVALKNPEALLDLPLVPVFSRNVLARQ